MLRRCFLKCMPLLISSCVQLNWFHCCTDFIEFLLFFFLFLFSPHQFLSSLKTVCINQYCQNPTLVSMSQLRLTFNLTCTTPPPPHPLQVPCNVTNTCNDTNIPCGGKCLPSTGLCPPPTNLCFPYTLTQPCDGIGLTCLVNQTLVQRANGSRYCTSAPTSCSITGFMYCENTTKCANLSDPLQCSFCPSGEAYCSWTKSCAPLSTPCCPQGLVPCALLGKCLASNSRCALTNTAPVVTTTLIYLESVASLNVSAALEGAGRSVGLLLGNGSLAVDVDKDEVGIAITDASPIAPDVGEWQYALCADIVSVDPPGGCSNLTSSWNPVGPVSDVQALVLTNRARLRFIRKDVRLEGAVWLRVKLWDGNLDGYHNSTDAVRQYLPFYSSTVPFVSNGTYSNGSALIAVLVFPSVLPPTFNSLATLKFSSIVADIPFVNNHGNTISDLIISVGVLYLPVLPTNSTTGWPVNQQQYDSQLPVSARGQYLDQVASVNPTRLQRAAALGSGQLPGVGVSIDAATSGVAGRWQVSWNGEEQYYTYVDTLVNPPTATTLFVNTTARLRFLPNPASCGNASILLQPWDGYWNGSSEAGSGYVLADGVGSVVARTGAGVSTYSTNAWQRATLEVTCVAYSPAILSPVVFLDPVPYQVSYHYDSLFTLLVARNLSFLSSRFGSLESALNLALLSTVQIVRLAAANATW